MAVEDFPKVYLTGSSDLSRGRSLQVKLREGLALNQASDGTLAVIFELGQKIFFKQMPASVRQVFVELASEGATIDELSEKILAADGGDALTRFYLHFNQLLHHGAIQHAAVVAGRSIAAIVGLAQNYQFHLQQLDIDRPYYLSRFAYCRREENRLLLECPLGYAQIVLHHSLAAQVLWALAQPHSVRQLAEHLPLLGIEGVADFFQLLLNAQALTPVSDEYAAPAEDGDATLGQWSFHDLLFHSRSRYGRGSYPFGATFRHIDRFPPLPALRSSPEGQKIDLYRPALDCLDDLPLIQVMEERRSVYDYEDSHPITVKQLGAFLYRVARVRSLGDMPVQTERGQAVMQISSRPYPAGGKCYEIEIYLTVDRCDGLSSGLYYYNPQEHGLVLLRERDRWVDALLNYASISAPRGKPQVLIHLAARFGRMSWKYDAIAYATTLKHVGILYQSMYLVATAMGLGPCALGSGDSDTFATAARTDYLAETSVGDFMLGSLPTTDTIDQ
ncbi:SagB family peptide dehydrogenase [Coleofasciculus sp.]|uniref:SagB family peptide dehydrogenase n=1 Tax=Coleofasciculus sp. TaxID=3100458 RepID=UPI0039F9C97D